MKAVWEVSSWPPAGVGGRRTKQWRSSCRLLASAGHASPRCQRQLVVISCWWKEGKPVAFTCGTPGLHLLFSKVIEKLSVLFKQFFQNGNTSCLGKWMSPFAFNGEVSFSDNVRCVEWSPSPTPFQSLVFKLIWFWSRCLIFSVYFCTLPFLSVLSGAYWDIAGAPPAPQVTFLCEAAQDKHEDLGHWAGSCSHLELAPHSAAWVLKFGVWLGIFLSLFSLWPRRARSVRS